MKKNFLNPYKWKRKFNRQKSFKNNSISIEQRISLRPDQSMEGRFKRNLYQKRPGFLKLKFELFFLFLLVLSIFGLLFFHPFFEIQKMEIQGVQRIDPALLEKILNTEIEGKTALVFKKNNFFLLNIQNLQKKAKDTFHFESLAVQKQFPKKLIIEVVEKPVVLIYDDGKEYLRIGANGDILESNGMAEMVEVTSGTPIHTPDLQKKKVFENEYPLLYNPFESEFSREMIIQKQIETVVLWEKFLREKTNIRPTYFEVRSSDEIFLHTDQKWGIHIKLGDTESAFQIFLSILPKVKGSAQEYVDMRYLTRVFFK